jgi:hypothetical protein
MPKKSKSKKGAATAAAAPAGDEKVVVTAEMLEPSDAGPVDRLKPFRSEVCVCVRGCVGAWMFSLVAHALTSVELCTSPTHLLALPRFAVDGPFSPATVLIFVVISCRSST